MLKHYVAKDGPTLDSKMRSSPLKPLFMLINLIAGVLLFCVYNKAEYWLLITLGVCFALLFILYVAFYTYLFCNNRDELR